MLILALHPNLDSKAVSESRRQANLGMCWCDKKKSLNLPSGTGLEEQNRQLMVMISVCQCMSVNVCVTTDFSHSAALL